MEFVRDTGDGRRDDGKVQGHDEDGEDERGDGADEADAAGVLHRVFGGWGPAGFEFFVLAGSGAVVTEGRFVRRDTGERAGVDGFLEVVDRAGGGGGQAAFASVEGAGYVEHAGGGGGEGGWEGGGGGGGHFVGGVGGPLGREGEGKRVFV